MVSAILKCEVASIVDSVMSDAATAVRKVASSDSRIFARNFLVLVGGIKKSLGYQKNALRYHPPPPVGLTPFSIVYYWNCHGGVQSDFPMPGMLSQFRDDGYFQAAFEV